MRYFLNLLLLIAPLYLFGQVTVESLKIDKTITGFQLAANFQGTQVYTQNGESDLNTVNPSAFSYSVLTPTTYEQAKVQIKQYMKMAADNGYTQADIKEADTIINGNKVYYISFVETLNGENYKNMAFHGFFLKGDTAVIFISGDLNGGRHIEAFKKTFFSTRF